ncbi:MAG: hypothetical protein COB59_04625 [Rhodospirillaceae bacterium]|nr:MAG: hypothetical protein COB59_04625 [Rhodospirillaceae bacterium]
MHWIDIFVIGALLISGAFGYSRGFVHEILSIAGWIGASFASLYGTPVLKHFMIPFIGDEWLAALVTGILIFIGTLIILSLTTRQISKGVKESALGALDRALGFLFGLARGALIVCLLWIGYAWTSPPVDGKHPEWVYIARTMPLIIQGADFLKSLAPQTQTDPNAPASKTSNSILKDGRTLLEKATDFKPKTPTDPGQNGYGRKERSEMDRLFETNQ